MNTSYNSTEVFQFESTQSPTGEFSENGTDFVNMSFTALNETVRPQSRKIILAYNMLLGVLILTGNGLIVVAMKKTKHMKPVTSLFVGQLAIADLCAGFMLIIRGVVTFADILTKPVCLELMAMIIFAFGGSISGICMMCLDTYLCVKHLTVQKAGITMKKACYMVAVTWLVWIILGHSIFFLPGPPSDQETTCTFAGGVISPDYMLGIITLLIIHFIMISLCQINSHRVLKAYKQSVREVVAPKCSQPGGGSEGQGQSSRNEETFLQKKMLKAIELTNAIVILVLIMFIVCWVPYIINVAILIMCPTCASKLFTDITASLVMLNSVGNFVIYLIKSSEFRSVLRKMFRLKNSSVHPFSTTSGQTSSTRAGTK